MKTLNFIQSEIEALQSQYRAVCSRNSGVIRGAEDSDEIGEKIQILMREYNARAKRHMYSGGKLVRRSVVECR